MNPFTYTEWTAFTPFFYMIIGVLLLPLMLLFRTKRNEKLIRWAVWLSVLWLLGCALDEVITLLRLGNQPALGAIVVDRLAQFGIVLVLVAAIISIVQLWDHLHHEGWFKGEILILMMFSALGMMLFVSTTNIFLLFLFLELFSLPLYALAGINRFSLSSAEGGIKYFITGAVASSIFLMGIVLLWGLTGTSDLVGMMSQVSSNFMIMNDPLFLIALLMVFFGILFKMSTVPMHQWTPDVYEGSPHPIAGFMSVATKSAAAIVLIRLAPWGFFNFPSVLSDRFIMIISVLAMLSIVVGTLTALAQSNIKRMLAFSSIAHAGYLLLAFIPRTDLSLHSLLYYLMVYGFTNLGAFGILTALGLTGPDATFEKIRGLGWRYPFLGIAATLFMLSLGGMPPMGGFYAKYLVFSNLIETGHLGLVLVAIFFSLVSIYFYLRLPIALFIETPLEGIHYATVHRGVSTRWATQATIVACVFAVMAAGIYPRQMYELAVSVIETSFRLAEPFVTGN